MSNNYFQFKQFIIYQDACALKVCTDACLFGATVVEFIHTNQIKIKQSLDIGTGTGLLSLMLAQKTNSQIDAVEIDEATFLQAKSNFKSSSFAEQLEIIRTDILNFETDKKYDLIISNPPFFESDLKSANQQKNNAKHDTALTFQQLLQVVNQNLNDDGFFAVLLPFHRVDYCIAEASKSGLFVANKILVKQTPTHDFFRGILFFNQKESIVTSSEIVIKNKTGNYTTEFTALLKDFYLHL